jgi:hypothetical protein
MACAGTYSTDDTKTKGKHPRHGEFARNTENSCEQMMPDSLFGETAMVAKDFEVEIP